MKKVLQGFILIFVIIPGLAQAGSTINFELTDYDFGTVKQGKQLRHDFKFTNTGDEDLVIEQINTS